MRGRLLADEVDDDDDRGSPLREGNLAVGLTGVPSRVMSPRGIGPFIRFVSMCGHDLERNVCESLATAEPLGRERLLPAIQERMTRRPHHLFPLQAMANDCPFFSICSHQADGYDGDKIWMKETCFQELGMRSGQKCRVRLASESGGRKGWRYAAFTINTVECPECPPSDIDKFPRCRMPEQFLFNLRDHEHDQLQPEQQRDNRLEVDVSSIIDPDGDLTDDMFASCVSIGLVTSPDYPGHVDYSLLLCRYFAIARTIFLQDIIPIPTAYCPELVNQIDDISSFILPKYIFFRVARIETSGSEYSHERGILIQKGRTRLIQLPAANSLIPAVHRISPVFDPSIVDKLLYVTAPYYNRRMKGPVWIILSGTRGVGKKTAIRCLGTETGMQTYDMDVNSLLLDTPSATEKRISDAILKSMIYSPCITHIQNFDLLIREQKGNEERYSSVIQQSVSSVDPRSVFIVSCPDAQAILSSVSFAPLFRHHVSMKEPNEEIRLKILKHLSRSCTSSNHLIDLTDTARKTNGFTVSDLKILITKSIRRRDERITRRQLDSATTATAVDTHVTQVEGTGRVGEQEQYAREGLEERDVSESLKEMKQRSRRAVGAPEIPEVKWTDVGGLDSVKKDIMDTIMMPMQYPHLFRSGLRRVGLLLHGPPGTGKTLIAKAVATECNINFLSIKGPELISMYVGQSEANVREVFAKGRSSLPCVIFFDELDSLAPNRGRSGDSGGVMDRVVSQLLAELDDMPEGLFIIGATNRPDLIDPALIRPGRFDKMINVGISEDKGSRIKILEALTGKFDLHPDIDYDLIEKSCPESLSGADFYSLVASAMNQSLVRAVRQIEEERVKEEDAIIQLTMDDFEQPLSTCHPTSLSLNV